MNPARAETAGRLMAEGEHVGGALVVPMRFGLEDRPGPTESVLFGLQHVLIMFTAMIASPLIIGQTLDLPPGLRGSLVTGVMLGCGLGTLISAFGVFGIGARLPLLLGAYTAFIGPVVAITRAEGPAAAAGAMMTGGFVLVAVSPALARLRPAFPPLVIGALLVITGQTLLKIAVTVGLGLNTPYFGSALPAGFLVASVVLIAAVTMMTKGLLRSLSIFLSLGVVYAAAVTLGLGRFQPVLDAPWFRFPSLLPFGLDWPSWGALSTVLIYYLVTAIYTMSIALAVCAMLGVDSSHERIRGAVAGDGAGSVLAVLFGGVPLISYDQNVGAISLTGVASRFVIATSGAILVVMAFVPKFAAAIGLIPPFVLGGTLVFMFGMIVVVGIRMLAEVATSIRDVLILAASIGLSGAVNFAPPGALEFLPPAARILALDGIVVGTLAAILLNLLIPNGPSESRLAASTSATRGR
ncbi:uracil-xanthine permease family protein [uncultured Enterovirga sp.]|uniref:uracil-xanthine permease family protein n=1 Tax=uncultured Enterovirga sp. TaxID=2026352 RepID=UPI0035CAAF0E